MRVQPFFTRKNIAVEINNFCETVGPSTKLKWRLRFPSGSADETYDRRGPPMGIHHKSPPTSIEGAAGQPLKISVFDFHKKFLWRCNCPADKSSNMICPVTRTSLGLMYRLAPIPPIWSRPDIAYTTRDLRFYVNFCVFSVQL